MAMMSRLESDDEDSRFIIDTLTRQMQWADSYGYPAATGLTATQAERDQDHLGPKVPKFDPHSCCTGYLEWDIGI